MQKAVKNQSLLDLLDAIQNIINNVRRVFFLILIVAVLVGSALVFIFRPLGPGHQGEYFYFAIAALLLLGWCLTQVGLPHLTRNSIGDVSLPVKFESDEDGNVKRWRISIENADKASVPVGGKKSRLFSFTKSFSIPIAQIPVEQLPDDQAIHAIREIIAQGKNVEEACREIHPPFDSMDSDQQGVCVLFVMDKLDKLDKLDEQE